MDYAEALSDTHIKHGFCEIFIYFFLENYAYFTFTGRIYDMFLNWIKGV